MLDYQSYRWHDQPYANMSEVFVHLGRTQDSFYTLILLQSTAQNHIQLFIICMFSIHFLLTY